MPFKFIELHCRSEKKDELIKRASSLGVELHFCAATNEKNEKREGVEIEVNSIEELKKALNEIRNFSYAIVKTDSQQIALRACKEINILLSCKLDRAIAKKIALEKGFFELCLRGVLTAQNGRERIRAIKEIKEQLKLLKKYKTKIIASYESKSELELRSARQIFELLKIFGLSEEEAKNACYKNAEEFLKMNKERLEGKLIQKGVRVIA